MRARLLFVGVVLGLVAAACSSDTAATTSTTTTAASTTTSEIPTTTAEPTTTTSQATPTTVAAVDPVDRHKDLFYMSVDGFDLKLDVYAPSGTTDAPLVVTFHGLSVSGKSDPDTVVVAQAAAEAGMVVFVPTWLHSDPIPLDAGKLASAGSIGNCAVAFAQAHASEYGGDPTRTVIDGFSAGIIPAMYATLGPALEPVEGCGVDVAPMPVLGAVLGDGETFLHGRMHDQPFADDPVGMGGEVGSWLDPSNWPQDMETAFFIWYANEESSLRRADDFTSDDGWLGTRDTDGSIRADLDRLEAFEDELVSTVDAAALLNLRLIEADIDVVLDGYPGGHTTQNKVPELVAYFEQAVGE